MILADIDIAQVQFPSPLAETEIDLVEFVQLLGGSVGLNRDIIICDGRLYFDSVAQHTAQLQVQGGVEYGILPVAKAYLSAEAALGLLCAEVEGSPAAVGVAIVESEGFHIEFIQHTVVTEALRTGGEAKREYPVGDNDGIGGGLFDPVEDRMDIVEPVIGFSHMGNGNAAGHDAGGIEQNGVGSYLESMLADIRLTGAGKGYLRTAPEGG